MERDNQPPLRQIASGTRQQLEPSRRVKRGGNEVDERLRFPRRGIALPVGCRSGARRRLTLTMDAVQCDTYGRKWAIRPESKCRRLDNSGWLGPVYRIPGDTNRSHGSCTRNSRLRDGREGYRPALRRIELSMAHK